MVGPRGTERTSQGRRRREIAFIKDPVSRMVVFSKRKKTLFKKASELSLLCGVHVAAIVFSQAGKPFAVGTPSVDHGLGVGFPDYAIDGATARRKDVASARVAEEQARMSAVGENVLRAAAGRSWWEADVEALGAEELPEFARALRRLRDNVRRRADKLPLAQPTTQLQ